MGKKRTLILTVSLVLIGTLGYVLFYNVYRRNAGADPLTERVVMLVIAKKPRQLLQKACPNLPDSEVRIIYVSDKPKHAFGEDISLQVEDINDENQIKEAVQAHSPAIKNIACVIAENPKTSRSLSAFYRVPHASQPDAEARIKEKIRKDVTALRDIWKICVNDDDLKEKNGPPTYMVDLLCKGNKPLFWDIKSLKCTDHRKILRTVPANDPIVAQLKKATTKTLTESGYTGTGLTLFFNLEPVSKEIQLTSVDFFSTLNNAQSIRLSLGLDIDKEVEQEGRNIAHILFYPVQPTCWEENNFPYLPVDTREAADKMCDEPYSHLSFYAIDPMGNKSPIKGKKSKVYADDVLCYQLANKDAEQLEKDLHTLSKLPSPIKGEHIYKDGCVLASENPYVQAGIQFIDSCIAQVSPKVEEDDKEKNPQKESSKDEDLTSPLKKVHILLRDYPEIVFGIIISVVAFLGFLLIINLTYHASRKANQRQNLPR